MSAKIAFFALALVAAAAAHGTSYTKVSRPHQDKYDYKIEHSKHGSWHGSAHPWGSGGLGDGTGSYELGGDSKVIGALPQGGGHDGWARRKRSAHGGWSKTSVSHAHDHKYDYDIDHSKHGHWHGSSHPHGYGGL
ncbi:Hypothetical protein NTJ_14130 [Nesidiocoris tenuis]|uniref:Uncharacterized protein n=1 Tax=Nesidiocoris tenuis TaxID=355587 RepID=A0ABN7BAH9_9HEMI|nr:Hypothetical protein NTJ_14130 [Nesidiocoris tenuis]